MSQLTQTYPYRTPCGQVFRLTIMGRAHEKRCAKCMSKEYKFQGSVDWVAFYGEDPATLNEDA